MKLKKKKSLATHVSPHIKEDVDGAPNTIAKAIVLPANDASHTTA